MGRNGQGERQVNRFIFTKKVNWISDADIRGFFDNVSHEQLLDLLGKRISDSRMLWLIGSFLRAGVMIEGRHHDTDEGVPQGSVLSPLLGNVYLHYVLDEWFERDVEPRMRGEAYLIHYTRLISATHTSPQTRLHHYSLPAPRVTAHHCRSTIQHPDRRRH